MILRPLALLLLLVSSGWSQVDASLFNDLKWRELGPAVFGGRIVDIAVKPGDSATIYAASGSGGLWVSENNGGSWRCIFENEGTISIGDIAIDPQAAGTIWIGTGEANNQRSSYWGDGVYRSDDGGETWTNKGLRDSHHIGRIVVDPGDSKTVWVAALGHLYSPNAERGLYRTRDGGESWDQVLDLGEDVGVVDVVLDPKDSKRIYAASYERRRRAWDFDGAGPGSAIWRSVDGGDSWQRLEGGLPDGEIGRIGLTAHAGETTTLFATVSNQNLAAPGAAAAEEGEGEAKAEPEGVELPFGLHVKIDGEVLKVTAIERRGPASRAGLSKDDVINSIAGMTPKSAEELESLGANLRPSDRVEFSWTSEGEERRRVLAATAPRLRQVGGEIYKSIDGGETWIKVNEKSVGGSPAYYYGQIRVDPSNVDRLFVLSVPLYESTDGGKTFDGGAGRGVHVDHHAFWIDPENPKRLLLGNDGGMHQSYDGGKTWDHLAQLPLAQFYAVAVDQQQPYHVYGGTQDNGSWGAPSVSRNGSIMPWEWYRIGGGDGFYVQVDPNDADIVFSESQFGALNRLDRRTGARSSIRPPQSDPDGPRDRYNWNSPILMSQHDSRVIYFGGNRLFRSMNRGDDWDAVSPDLTTADPDKLAGNVPHCTITSVAEHPEDRRRLIVGTDDGKVQQTRDGGKTWKDLSGGFPLRPANWWVSRVAYSRSDAKRVYVSFTGYREDDFRAFLFRSDDEGASWRSIAGDLPAVPVNVVLEDPRNPDLLYVGTEFGVYASLDGGQRWKRLGSDLPRVAVHDLTLQERERELVIGTHGRGIYVLDVRALQELSAKRIADFLAKKPFLFSVKDSTRWRRPPSSTLSGQRRYVGRNPRTGVAIRYYLPEEVKDEDIKLVIEDDKGASVRTLNPASKAGLHSLRWDLGRGGEGRGRRGARGGRGGRGARRVPNGVYWAVLSIGDLEYTRRFELRDDPVLGDR